MMMIDMPVSTVVIKISMKYCHFFNRNIYIYIINSGIEYDRFLKDETFYSSTKMEHIIV